jgi:hypothetical protein
MNFYDPTGRPKITASRPAPQWAASTWGPYFDAMFPPQEVSTWISWKMTSTGTNIARRLWHQREELRAEYEDVHGTDRARWPVQHPGVVLDAVLSSAHGACLGCQWFDVRGHSMSHPDWFERASLYGRTDTKSPMVYSSMVHAAGGEGGSIRHDDEMPAPAPRSRCHHLRRGGHHHGGHGVLQLSTAINQNRSRFGL